MADELTNKVTQLYREGLTGVQIIQRLRGEGIIVPFVVVRQIISQLEE